MIYLLLFALLYASLLAAHEISFRAGTRLTKAGASRPDLGAVAGAMLGLLGLLLGFSFAGASGRFVDRQDLIVREANSLGTAWLRTSPLPEPARTELRNLLLRYADARIALGNAPMDRTITAAVEKSAADLHAPIWHAGVAATARDPDYRLLLFPALNELIDLYSLRFAAAHRHHPVAVIALLVLACVSAIALLGYGAGIADRDRRAFHLLFPLLVACVLWLVVDMDFPRSGLVRGNQAVLVDARAAMVP
jgi:hypothetical protein